jgi:polyferredoxin
MAQRMKLARRQKTRRTVLWITFLLFPVVMNYISPYVIIDAAFQGIVNGSMIVFGLFFVASIFLGRLWCAWGCPGAGIQEACFQINDGPARGGKLDWIKWGIWIPWIVIIVVGAISAGGYRTVDFLHLTETGVSVDAPMKYITYYMVIGIVFALSLTAGRRAFCHYGCWMSPFMILGRKLRNALRTPALRLRAEPDKCIQCKQCTQACPMSLSVNEMVKVGKMENVECILCGSCIDICPKDVLHYAFDRKS